MNFSTQLPNPYYYAIIMIGKLDSDFTSSAANRVVLSLTRSKQSSSTVTNQYFKNTINSGIWSNNISELGAPPMWQITEEDAYLRIKYFSSNKTCYLYSSRDASQYEFVQSYILGEVWSLGSGNSIYVALNAGSEPFQTLSEYNENSNKNFNLSQGKFYFSDFKITQSVISSGGGGGGGGGGGSSQFQKSMKGKGKSSSAKKSSGGSSKDSKGSKPSSKKKSGGSKKSKK